MIYKLSVLDGLELGKTRKVRSTIKNTLKALLLELGYNIAEITNMSCVLINSRERLVSGMKNNEPLVVKITKE